MAQVVETYPKVGPKKGAQTRMAIGMARSCGAQTSERVALPTLSAGLPKQPARKRHTVKLAMDCEKPAPSVKSAKMGVHTKYTALRPKFSLHGDAMRGPKARPRV